ncbi:MAG: 3-deoxy-D-manno-octulosonic acid transferase, partial [Hyphomicrobiales bacterium]
FLKTWQPALAVFVESELWPNTMTELTKRHIPQVLVNARMSERSFARWKKIGSITHALFDNVNLCIAQTEEDAARFSELGVQGVINGGNLKFDSDMPEIDEIAFSRLQSAIGGRRIWLAASTHDQEEMIVAKAHMHLKRTFPDLLTIVVPRHPHRAEEIVSSLANLNLNVVQRSHNEMPKLTDDIYIADTIGELALFYSLSPCSLVGGSLVPHGGQNPIEPARLGSAIVHGPNVENFANIFTALGQRGGCVCVKNSEELVRQVADILANRDRSEQMTKAADQALQGLGGALERTHNALMPYLRPLILSGRLADADDRYVAGE